MNEAIGLESTSDKKTRSFAVQPGLPENWEESHSQETLKVSTAGYLRSQNVWQHLPTKLEIPF
jgi:hypothetical protein